MNRNFLILFLITILILFADNTYSQNIIRLEKNDTIKTIKCENILRIVAENHTYTAYGSKLIGDSVYFFNSSTFIFIDSTNELSNIRCFKTPDGYSYTINVKDIQALYCSKMESKKYDDKHSRHVHKTIWNFVSSIGLITTGVALIIPGIIVPGAIVISVGVMNRLKFLYDKRITFKTEGYDLIKDWEIIK